jgi:Flp pilus assembly protein TadD
MDRNNLIGREIGNYRIITEINSGAYGSVYKAEHVHLSGRIVAIKLLHTYMGSPKEREQFVQEAQFLARLGHPYILPLIDFGFSERQPYLIAQYAAGGSLRDLLRRRTPLPPATILTILVQVGEALYYAHQQNIIHRDLKPENILFNTQGNALLADFGIATMLSSANSHHLTTIGGTPSYMAPEQFRGIISREGDQYALGCITYELFTGRQLFTAPDFISLGFKHLTERPILPTYYNPNLPIATEKALLKALAKQRTERHTDIPTFLAALQASFTPATIPPVAVSAPPAQPAVSERTVVSEHTKARWLKLGNEHTRAGHFAEALAAYEEAIAINPRDVDAYYNKGVVLDELKRYEEAIEAYEGVIGLNPQYTDAYNNKGIALDELKRYEEAIRCYEQAIGLNPQYADAYNNKGIALYNLGRYEEALRCYEQAIASNPQYILAYKNKGNALQQLARQTEAQQAYAIAQQLRGTNHS